MVQLIHYCIRIFSHIAKFTQVKDIKRRTNPASNSFFTPFFSPLFLDLLSPFLLLFLFSFLLPLEEDEEDDRAGDDEDLMDIIRLSSLALRSNRDL